MERCLICGAAHAVCTGVAPQPEHIIDLEGPMASNMWTSERRLYLDQDGNVVEADDPKRASLLVGQGGQLPLADAERYGLLEKAEQAEVKAVAPKANKAKAGPENK